MNTKLEGIRITHALDYHDFVAAVTPHLHLSKVVGERYKDVWLARFLTAFGNAQVAADKFKAMLEFRSNFGLDRIRECFEDGSMKIENIPGYTAHYIACPDTFLLASGRSKAGEPIYVQSLALWDYDRYLFQIPQDMEDMFQYYHLEYLFMLLDQASEKTGYLVGCIKIVDLDGVMWQMRGEIMRLRHSWERRFERIGYHLDECFPEQASRIFVVNAPSWFTSVWAIVSPCIPATTIGKIKVETRERSPSLLKRFIANEVLPVELGGGFDGPWMMGKKDGGEIEVRERNFGIARIVHLSDLGPLQLDRVDDKDASCTPPCSPLGGTWEKSFFLGSGPGSAIPWASDDEESMFPLLPGHPPRRATGAGHAPDEFVVPPMTPPAGGDTHAVTFSVAELEEASVEALNGSAEGGLTPLPWAPDDPLLPGQPPWRAAGVDGSAEGGLTPLPGVDTDDFFYPLKGAGKEEKPGSAAQEAVAEVDGAIDSIEPPPKAEDGPAITTPKGRSVVKDAQQQGRDDEAKDSPVKGPNAPEKRPEAPGGTQARATGWEWIYEQDQDVNEIHIEICARKVVAENHGANQSV